MERQSNFWELEKEYCEGFYLCSFTNSSLFAVSFEIFSRPSANSARETSSIGYTFPFLSMNTRSNFLSPFSHLFQILSFTFYVPCRRSWLDKKSNPLFSLIHLFLLFLFLS